MMDVHACYMQTSILYYPLEHCYLHEVHLSIKRSKFLLIKKPRQIYDNFSHFKLRKQNHSKLLYDIALASLSEFEMELRATISHTHPSRFRILK